MQEYSSWPSATRPWQRVHIDFAGPIFGSMWLIGVDAFSQFPFICQLSTTTSLATISLLSTIFSIEGLPETLVSDNGPQLTSEDFESFCSTNGIQHLTTAPFHPASNGLAERFVRTFKTSVAKNIEDGLSVKDAVLKYLLTYRTIPNSEGKTPSELLHGRKIRTLLTQMPKKPPHQELNGDDNRTKYKVNDPVFIRNFARGDKWIKGRIEKVIGKMVYWVKTDLHSYKRHQNQMKPRSFANEPTNPFLHPVKCCINDETNIQEETQQPESFERNTTPPQATEQTELRRSQRTRTAVARFNPEDFRNKRRDNVIN